MPFLVSKTVAAVATTVAISTPIEKPPEPKQREVIQSVVIATNPFRYLQPCVPDHMRHPNARTPRR